MIRMLVVIAALVFMIALMGSPRAEMRSLVSDPTSRSPSTAISPSPGCSLAVARSWGSPPRSTSCSQTTALPRYPSARLRSRFRIRTPHACNRSRPTLVQRQVDSARVQP